MDKPSQNLIPVSELISAVNKPIVINPVLQQALGTGLVFPIMVNATGGVDLTSGIPLLRSSIKIILSWILGTKLMNGAFGSTLLELLEEPNDDILSYQVYNAVENAIETWETRIKLLDTNVNQTEDGVTISLIYQIVGTNIQDSFIFPYYTQVLQ